jgi:hypothetical protein
MIGDKSLSDAVEEAFLNSKLPRPIASKVEMDLAKFLIRNAWNEVQNWEAMINEYDN